MTVPGKRLRWTLCTMLFLATTLNYLDRQTLSVLAPQLQTELQLDNRQLGMLFSAFYWSYTLGQFAVGLALDRYSLRWLYGGGVLAWSMVSAATGLSTGFAMLFGFRVLLGLMESGNWPGALRIISRVMPPEERALGNGLFTSGTSVGALVAPAVILGLAAWQGWRTAFVAVGSLGLFWFALWVPVSARIHFGEASARGVTPRTAWGEIFRLRAFWLLFVITSLINPCLYFFLNWTPSFLAQSYGIRDAATLAKILTAVFLGLDLGYLFCGVIVLYLKKRGVSLPAARRAVCAVATLLLSPALLLAQRPELAVMIGALIVCNFACGLWISIYLTLAQEVSERHLSTAAGLLGGSGSLFGALAMTGVGAVTASTGSYAIPFLTVPAAAAVATWAAWRVTARERTAFESKTWTL
ncbi:MAG: MFS transporter [Bryobacteraceae bacterium]